MNPAVHVIELDRVYSPRAAHRNGPEIGRASDLRTIKFPPISYLVPGYIAEGCTILAGRPKLGKSWLCLEIGLGVATGGNCLGSINCAEGSVLYLALEDNRRRLQRRLDRLLPSVAADWPERLHYATEWPKAEEGGLDHLRNWIERTPDARLIIVDVLAAFRSSRGNQQSLYEADYAAVAGLQALASEYSVGVVIVHHVRKGPSEVDPFEKVSGTMGLTGAADSVLVLDREANGVTLYGRGRDIEEIETALRFDSDMCRWVSLGEASEVRRTDERAEILSVLIDASEPLNPREIAIATQMPRNNVDQLLFKMAKGGEVLKTGRGRYIHHGRTDLLQPPHKNDKKIRDELTSGEGGLADE
jgi:hypothetical protein